MPADLASFNPVLKEDYKELVEQLNSNVWLLPQIEQKSGGDSIQGRRAVHPVHTRRSSGIGSRAEGGTLPTASQQSYATVNVPLRYHFGRIQLSLQVIEQGKAGDGAFIDALDSEMMGLKKDVTRDRCRQIWGTSNGVIAQCGVTTAATLVVLAPGTTQTQLRQLYFDGGMIVDIGTVANPVAVATARAVTAVGTVASPTITISGANVTTSALHFVFRSGNGGASSNSGLPNDGQLELTGLQTIVDNSSILHTINPASEPVWRSGVFTASGLPTEALINNAITDQADVSGEVVDALVSNRGVNQAIANLMLSTKRHVMPAVELKGGYKGIEWNTPAINSNQASATVLAIDTDCPANSLFGIHFGSLRWYQHSGSGWEWMEDDGAILTRVANQAAYEATLYSFSELSSKRRNTHFRINGITEVSA